MTLAEYHASLCALTFARTPPAELAELTLYREMARARLIGMAQVAYRRSWAQLGKRACDQSFARYLASVPPRSPFLREAIAGFADFAADDELAARAPFARDLLRIEQTKWRVSDLPYPDPGALAELDFEGTLVLNPTLSLLRLEHDVDAFGARDERGDEPAPRPIEPCVLLVYRRADEDDVHWYRAPFLFAELLRRAQTADYSAGVLLRALLSEHGLAADEELLSGIAVQLEAAVERTVLLGVRA